MAAYTDWCDALVNYFVGGRRRGEKIYLNVDEDALFALGSKFGSDRNQVIESFVDAVRHKFVIGNTVNLSPLYNSQFYKSDQPEMIGFLALMVLAASRMMDESGETSNISSSNYFMRLCQTLNVDPASPNTGRPRGLTEYEEVKYWEAWNRWLRLKGFQATARPGTAARIYVKYPETQTLLRATDKKRLRKLFSERKLQHEMDSETLMSDVRQTYLPGHLKELVEDIERYDVVTDAVQGVHQDWLAYINERENLWFETDEDVECDYNEWAEKSVGTTRSLRIEVGLYRKEELFGTRYLLLPMCPRGHSTEKMQVQMENGEIQNLYLDKPGFYNPIGEVGEAELLQGATYEILVPASYGELVLPEGRSYWILTPDPDDPEYGDYATWDKVPPLGSAFKLLCHIGYLSWFQALRERDLLDWQGEAQPMFGGDTWVELHQCQVRAHHNLKMLNESQRSLYDKLCPRIAFSLSFTGGLRVPDKTGWIEGFAPELTVYGFVEKAQVTLYLLTETDRNQIDSFTVEMNKSYPLDLREVGNYLVEVVSNNTTVERMLRIVAWDSLPLSELPYELRTAVDFTDYRICGAVVTKTSEQSNVDARKGH